MNSYLKQAAKRGASGHGKASEKKTAKRLGAKLTPASGAMPTIKGDMHAGDFLVESKSTKHASMSLEYSWLVKISSEAFNERKHPAVSLTFVEDAQGTPRFNGRWVLVPESLFKEKFL